MKRGSTLFLQAVVVLIGIGALAFLLAEPHFEGANVHKTSFEIYFTDPFLAYLYVSSIPLFLALLQIFKVLGYARRDQIFSHPAVRALATTKYCAMSLIAFVAGAELFIMLSESDDRAGGVMIGVMIAVGSVIVATAAGVFEKLLHTAVEMKSENDLTV